MARETFTERFNRLTASMGETELATILGLSISAVRKLRAGDTQTLKIDGALRLCDRLGVDPWMLAFGDQARQPAVSMLADGTGSPDPWRAIGLLQKQMDEMRKDLRSLREPAPGQQPKPPRKATRSA